MLETKGMCGRTCSGYVNNKYDRFIYERGRERNREIKRNICIYIYVYIYIYMIRKYEDDIKYIRESYKIQHVCLREVLRLGGIR